MTCMWSHTERQADNDVYVVTHREAADNDVYVVTHREAG